VACPLRLRAAWPRRLRANRPRVATPARSWRDADGGRGVVLPVLRLRWSPVTDGGCRRESSGGAGGML